MGASPLIVGCSMKEEKIGFGKPGAFLSDDDVRKILVQAFDRDDFDGERILIIIPDGTRTAPIPLFFRMLCDILLPRVAKLDFLIALGTHPLMSEGAIERLLGMPLKKRRTRYASVNVFNHRWDVPKTFTTIGVFSARETEELSHGRLSLEVPITINKAVFDYDRLVVCGPVFPHEVAGFSGGSKYFFPGISGAEIINFTHWLGALETSYETIGVKDTSVRRSIERAAAMIDRKKMAICMVTTFEGLVGMYVGDVHQAWNKAADLSSQVHIRYVEKPYERVLSILPSMYDDLWTGAKGMYKLEPVVADGGEVIIYAPHLNEVSYTHGRIIDQIGYHVRDYFLAQWNKFKDYPWGVLAHSTHLRGLGTYQDGIEHPRIRVTLATGIPKERCERINLGYLDPATIDPKEWEGRQYEGLLVVPHAGEVLYRLKGHEG